MDGVPLPRWKSLLLLKVAEAENGDDSGSVANPSFSYSAPKVIHRWRGDLPTSPQSAVNNFAAQKNFVVNNFTFTHTVQVNAPGPEDECRFLNARRLRKDFRSGPGALMQRNSQSLSPASATDRDEPAIRTSIHQSPRVLMVNILDTI
jgi:hypothetical protein